MKTKIFFNIFTFLFIFSMPVLSQDHDHEHHEHASFELGTGAGIAFSSENQSFDPAVHLHLTKLFSEKLGAAIGYEVILGEEIHQSLALALTFLPSDHLVIQAGPALIFPVEENEILLAGKIESTFILLEKEKFHLGPVLDAGFSRHGYHIILGLHLGFGLK